VNDPAQMAHLLEAGVDGLITDDTVALRDLLASRGLWPAAS